MLSNWISARDNRFQHPAPRAERVTGGRDDVFHRNQCRKIPKFLHGIDLGNLRFQVWSLRIVIVCASCVRDKCRYTLCASTAFFANRCDRTVVSAPTETSRPKYANASLYCFIVETLNSKSKKWISTFIDPLSLGKCSFSEKRIVWYMLADHSAL